MELRVTAEGRSGRTSDRAASDKSVLGITEPGQYWAVDAKVENANSDQLRKGAIARFWGTEHGAEADAAAIRRGERLYKGTGLRYVDPVVTRAHAYWR